MPDKTDRKEQIWLTLFLLVPVLILVRLSDIFAESNTGKFFFAGLFGAIGGLLGFGLYHFVKASSFLKKSITLTILLLVSISILYLVSESKKSNLLTCEVCGYKSINSKDSICQVCETKPWERFKNWKAFEVKRDYIEYNQLLFFGIDSLNQKIDFYSPQTIKTFDKDNNWKPILTAEKIREDFLLE